MAQQPDLFENDKERIASQAGPVTCLGLTFENDEERRRHFTKKLREKLHDPEFRKIEGFPIGSDEDILNLGDPPYYACPNPWIPYFIKEWETQNQNFYHREPFATDVSECKNNPFYNVHSYTQGAAQDHHALHPPLYRTGGYCV